MKVRRAREGDLDQFAKNLQSVADEGRYIFTEEVTEERKKSMGRLFKDKGCLAVVAEVGSGKTRKLVGSLTLERYGNVEKTRHVRVLGMLVVKGYRGMGIGTKLIAYALDWAKSQKDLEKVVLGVFSNNRRGVPPLREVRVQGRGDKEEALPHAGRHADEIDMAFFLSELIAEKGCSALLHA